MSFCIPNLQSYSLMLVPTQELTKSIVTYRDIKDLQVESIRYRADNNKDYNLMLKRTKLGNIPPVSKLIALELM